LISVVFLYSIIDVKYFFIVMIFCSLGEGYYVRGHMPGQWNAVIHLLKVPEPSADAITPRQKQINDAADKFFASATSVVTNMAASLPNAPGQVQKVKTFVAPNPLPARANWTWTTAEGKTYQNVVITKVEPDCVTILDSEGGARVETSQLPVDVQQMLNYDPESAADAEIQRGESDHADQIAMDQASQAAKQAKLKRDTEAEANTAKIQADGHDAEDAVDADLRIQDTKKKMADYQDDLAAVSKRVYFVQGVLSGEAYYVDRYNKDTAEIASCQAIIAAGGK
jgi:hypothetical protein